MYMCKLSSFKKADTYVLVLFNFLILNRLMSIDYTEVFLLVFPPECLSAVFTLNSVATFLLAYTLRCSSSIKFKLISLKHASIFYILICLSGLTL